MRDRTSSPVREDDFPLLNGQGRVLLQEPAQVGGFLPIPGLLLHRGVLELEVRTKSFSEGCEPIITRDFGARRTLLSSTLSLLFSSLLFWLHIC